jgi:hypothetical protein
MRGKKREKEVIKKTGIKDHYLTLGLILLAVSISLFVVLTQQEVIYEETFHPSITGGVVFTPHSDLQYNSKEKIVKDITNLTYDFSGEKVMIDSKNGERGFEFYVEADGEEYHFNQPVERKSLTSGKTVFSNKGRVNGLEIEQEIIFSNSVPVKFNHYVTNNKKQNLQDLTYYYVFDVFEEDVIAYKNFQCDGKGNCADMGEYTDFNSVSFEGLHFKYTDLINMGFSLEEFTFKEDKLYLGFKNNKTLESDEKISLDPTFASTYVVSADMTPLTNNTFVLVWSEFAPYVIKAAIYTTDGLQIGETIFVDTYIRWYGDDYVSVDAFNSTHFIIGWFDHYGGHYRYSIYNSGLDLIDEREAYCCDYQVVMDVAALNESHYVISWTNDKNANRTRFDVGDIDGNLISNDVNGLMAIGASDEMSLAAVNDTHFVQCVLDQDSSIGTVRCETVDIWGTKTGSNTIQTYVGTTMHDIFVEMLNSTHYVVAYHDSYGTNRLFYTISDIYGTDVSSNVAFTENTGSYPEVSVAPVNETHFVFGYTNPWMDTASFDTYAYKETELLSWQNVSTDIYTNWCTLSPMAATSRKYARNIEICDDNFIIAWGSNDSASGHEAMWGAYHFNGSEWDGICSDIELTLNVLSPQNITYYKFYVPFNLSFIARDGADTCVYSLDGGSNRTMPNVFGNIWTVERSFAKLTSHHVEFWCKDDDGDVIYAESAFSIGDKFFLTDPTHEVASMQVAPMDGNKFVAVWINEFRDGLGNDGEVWATVLETSGKEILPPTRFFNNVGASSYEGNRRISVAPLNTTHFVTAWFVHTGSYYAYQVYDIYGNNVSGAPVIFENTKGYDREMSVSVAALNETHVVLAYLEDDLWSDSGTGDASYEIWDVINEVEVVNEVDVDTNMNDGSYIYIRTISVTALNESHFVVGWYDMGGGGQDIKAKVYAYPETALTADLFVDNYVNTAWAMVEVSALNESHFVVGWYDRTSQNDTNFKTYDSEGNLITDETQICPFVSTDSHDVSITALNDSHLASSCLDFTQKDASFRVFDSEGTANTAVIDVDTNINTTSTPMESSVASKRYGDGTEICNDNFIMAWTSNYNETYWGAYYPNGTEWNGICCYDTCTYPGSGNWDINCSDYCNITDSVVGDGSDIIISGHGHTIISANITGFDDIHVDGGTGHCRVTCREGGCIHT